MTIALELLAWLVCIVTFLWSLYAFGLRFRARRRPHYVQARTDDHDAKVAALTEWLAQPAIRSCLYRNGIASQSGLGRLHRTVGKMTEIEVDARLKLILDNRNVRVEIAKHFGRKYGVPRQEAMRELLALAGKEA